MLTQISFLFSGHGFGINTNIFETNLINLAVVIAVVISVGGDALRELLSNRKQTILDNLSSAEQRAKEIEDKINQARQRAEQAEAKAIEIRQSGFDAAEKEKKACIDQAEKEAYRLRQLKQDTLNFEQQKVSRNIAQQIIALSVQLAEEKVEKMPEEKDAEIFHEWVNDHKMTFWATIQDYARRLVLQ